MNIKIKLMPWQRAFLEDPHRIKVLLGSRQIGKSHLLYAELARVCGTTPGRSAVVMPVQSQANDFFKVMVAGDNFDQLVAMKPDGTPDFKLWPYPQINFRSGHYLEFRSFEHSRRLRGGKWTGVVVIDEANDLDGDEISRVILPKVSTTDAKVLIASTISHHNWLFDLFLKGQTDVDPLLKSWKFDCEYGFKFQGVEGKKRLNELKSITPQWIWDSEYLVVPSSDNSTAFPYMDRCIIKEAPPKGPDRGQRFLIGLDLGRVRDQEIAICVREDGLIVDLVEFPTGSGALDHSQMAQRINSLSHHWNDARVVVDCTGRGGRKDEGDSHAAIYEQVLDDRFEPMYWSGNKENESKYNIISHLALMTEHSQIRIPENFRTLIAQLRAYRILKSKGKNSTFGPAPKAGINDDAVAALAQAIWGIKNDWFGENETTNNVRVGNVAGLIG